MTQDELFLRRTVVFISALIYWTGVLVQAYRVRRQIRRSPNLKPRSARETFLWMGWLIVIIGWAVQPFLVRGGDGPFGMRLISTLLNPGLLLLGLALVLVGYAFTLWCYAAMGDTWRIGINRHEKNALVTHGPYRLVRHPIYLFQFVILAGVALLLPTPVSIIILGVHLACVLIKSSDEESYLLTAHGIAYRDYLAHTGRLIPKLRRKKPESR